MQRKTRGDGQRLSADFGPPSPSSAADIFFPPGNSITRADAVVAFDFALKPSTVIWSPTLRVSRDHPFCASSPGLAASRVHVRSPLVSVALIWMTTCGLLQSIR